MHRPLHLGQPLQPAVGPRLDAEHLIEHREAGAADEGEEDERDQHLRQGDAGLAVTPAWRRCPAHGPDRLAPRPWAKVSNW